MRWDGLVGGDMLRMGRDDGKGVEMERMWRLVKYKKSLCLVNDMRD